jgi:hypothetical protein
MIPEGISEGAVAIEFKHNGRVWKADTVEEAITLRRRLEMHDQIAFEAGEDIPSYEEERKQVWSPDTVTDLLKNIGSQQKRFLEALANGTAVPSEKILKALSLDSEVAFAGVLSGLSKQLKKLGIKTADLYTVTVNWTGKSKVRSFRVSSEFSDAADELGWPENWK